MDTKRINPWPKNIKTIVCAIFLLFIFSFGLHKLYREATMPPSIVYIIPDDFIGPVFVFFGQKDGVTPSPDILGHAVLVPENGVVKIKQNVDDIIPDEKDGQQNMHWVTVSKTGSRKKIIVNENTQQESSGELYEIYYDDVGQPHKHPVIKSKHPFYYFSELQRNEKMIFGHEGCQNQFRENDSDPTEKPPVCGKFLVISPNQFLTMPSWMWEGTRHPYASIKAFEDAANERVKKKKEFYR
jgi:hypothetical protein